MQKSTIKKTVFLILASYLLTHFYLWWKLLDRIYDIVGNSCHYPNWLYPFCHFAWWYSLEIFIFIFIILSFIYWILKRTK
jgi:hypothetical protein